MSAPVSGAFAKAVGSFAFVGLAAWGWRALAPSPELPVTKPNSNAPTQPELVSYLYSTDISVLLRCKLRPKVISGREFLREKVHRQPIPPRLQSTPSSRSAPSFSRCRSTSGRLQRPLRGEVRPRR